jgi:hypothetical protein
VGNTQLDNKVADANSSKKILGVTRFWDMNRRWVFLYLTTITIRKLGTPWDLIDLESVFSRAYFLAALNNVQLKVLANIHKNIYLKNEP